MSDRRVEELPEAGLLIVVHPEWEDVAELHADRQELPYLVTDLCPEGQLYILNVDKLQEQPIASWGL